jgi:hypothetical protein
LISLTWFPVSSDSSNLISYQWGMRSGERGETPGLIGQAAGRPHGLWG